MLEDNNRVPTQGLKLRETRASCLDVPMRA
jgi:hypothetical protein